MVLNVLTLAATVKTEKNLEERVRRKLNIWVHGRWKGRVLLTVGEGEFS